MTSRIVLIVAAVAGAGLLVAQAFMNRSVANSEQQPYDVLWKKGMLEARFYPTALLATVSSDERSYKAASNRHFRVLAGYIFGGNQEKASIAMTTPVHMQFDGKGSTMSFVMPTGMSMDGLPLPNDTSVRFEQANSRQVVALEFGGWADDTRIAEKTRELLAELSKLGISPKGNPWFMAYNPPFQLTNRRNEVAVEISALPIGE